MLSSSAGACEIVAEEEVSYPHQFKELKPINCKVRVDTRFEKIYGCSDGFRRGPPADALDLVANRKLTVPLCQAGFEVQQKNTSTKPVRVGSVPQSSGVGTPESVTLKQALRKLCISQASEMAAMKRLSKPAGTSGISEATTLKRPCASVVVQPDESSEKEKGNLFEISIVPQKIDTKLVDQAFDGSGETCKVECFPSKTAEPMKPRLKDVIASPLSDFQVKSPVNVAKGSHSIMFCLSPRLTRPASKTKKSPLKDNGSTGCSVNCSKVKDVGPSADSVVDSGMALGGQRSEGESSKEKGESSQSSKSSMGDHSSSTSVSDESSQSASSGRGYSRPHTSKDMRWKVIRQVEMRQGSLGLDNFALLKRLGCGDIGTVYLAELVGAECLFALKVMDVDFLRSRKKMLRAQTEREILQILDHPFLPTLYTHFTTENLSCLVMEYCPGGDLHVLRQRQPSRCFSEPAARFYVAEVLLALEYLHMLGVVYRDLKPENILVREDGHIMLSDFDLSLQCAVNPTLLISSSLGDSGRRSSSCSDPRCLQPSWVNISCFGPASASAAAAAGEGVRSKAALPQLVAEPTSARSNSFVGTHEYLAPEIIKGDGHGSAVDWWTLGVFLYELLYGRTPFKGAVNEETLANAVTQDLYFPASPAVSVQAKALIRALLAKEPENRLGSLKGAADIKQHSFFHGLNWALIRSATPPETPPSLPLPPPPAAAAPSGKKETRCFEFGTHGERVEFELF